jgi:hypothetical protein
MDEHEDVDPAVIAAWIGAGIAVLVALLSAYFTVWSSYRQRAVDLVVAALSHMGGGTQERSSGIAALMALRGPLARQPGRFDSRGWAIYGPAVGQQLYRQLIYVLNQGKEPYDAHEVENVISMTEWLTSDSRRLGFCDPGQRHRLAVSLAAYADAAPRPPQSSSGQRPTDLKHTSIEEFLSRVDRWKSILDTPPSSLPDDDVLPPDQSAQPGEKQP